MAAFPNVLNLPVVASAMVAKGPPLPVKTPGTLPLMPEKATMPGLLIDGSPRKRGLKPAVLVLTMAVRGPPSPVNIPDAVPGDIGNATVKATVPDGLIEGEMPKSVKILCAVVAMVVTAPW